MVLVLKTKQPKRNTLPPSGMHMTYAASSFGLDISKGQPTEATGTHTWWQCDLTSPSVFVPRTAALEKEVAGFREKIHHLDDMLKSQQRKVRQMIEQVKGGGGIPFYLSCVHPKLVL